MDARRTGIVVAAVLVVVLVAVLTSHPLQVGRQPATDSTEGERGRFTQRGPPDVKLVAVDPQSDTLLWPYTSRAREFDTLTLPINVVVKARPSRVRSLLTTGADAEWNESRGEWEGFGDAGDTGDGEWDEDGNGNEDSGRWYEAHGSTRYTYVYEEGPDGGWTDEHYQLHHGEYFGARYHIRAYLGGDGNRTWTAMQAHYEHWDWFRLRHTVGSTSLGRRYVERDFYGEPAVSDVSRERFANGGISDADGWSVVVELLPPPPFRQSMGGPTVAAGWMLLLVAGVSLAETVRERTATLREHVGVEDSTLRLGALATLSVGFFPALRWGAITVEQSFPGLSPKLVAGTGYLLVAFGLPACAVFAGRLERGLAPPLILVVGLAMGFVVDYVSIGVVVIPLEAFAHRGAVLAALGAIAAVVDSESDVDPPITVALGLLWVGTLVWPLLDVL